MGTTGIGTRGGPRPRGKCLRCGRPVAIRTNGKPWAHGCVLPAEDLAAALIELAYRHGGLAIEPCHDNPGGAACVYLGPEPSVGATRVRGGAVELARALLEVV